MDGRSGGAAARKDRGVLVVEGRPTAASDTDVAGNGAIHGLAGGKSHYRTLPMLGGVGCLGWDGGVAHEFAGLKGRPKIKDDRGNHIGDLGRRNIDEERDIVVLPEGP